MPSEEPVSPREGSGVTALLWALSLLSTLPLWLCTYPPLTDYPQHLAMASILRHYGDPAFHLRETYRLALWHPNSLFEIAVAMLALVFPIGIAGKLVLGAAIAGVGPAAAALARRA